MIAKYPRKWLGCLLIVVASCSSSVPPDRAIVEKRIGDFFEVYKKNGPKKAISQLLMTNKYISEKDVETLGNSLEDLARDFDDYQGYEVISITDYGNSIKTIVCIAKYSQTPIQFKFRFYQPGNGWKIQDFSFKTQFIND